MTAIEQMRAYRDELKASVKNSKDFDPILEAHKAEEEEKEMLNLQLEIADLQEQEMLNLSR